MSTDFRRSVDVIVVTHNSPSLGDEFSAIAEAANLNLIVVDNASTILPVVPIKAKLIPLTANDGFGAACNLGFSHGSAEFVLFLNPDCLITPDTVAALAEIAMEHETDGAIVSPRTRSSATRVLPGGAEPGGMSFLIQYLRLGATLLPTRGFNRYDGNTPERTVRVDWVGGGCMLMQRRLFSRLGGFDEAFFMYGEDVDLCLRARDLGAPSLLAGHLEGIHEFGTGSPASTHLRMAWLRNLRVIVARRKGRSARVWFDSVIVSRALLMNLLRPFGIKPSLGRPNLQMLREYYFSDSETHGR